MDTEGQIENKIHLPDGQDGPCSKQKCYHCFYESQFEQNNLAPCQCTMHRRIITITYVKDKVDQYKWNTEPEVYIFWYVTHGYSVLWIENNTHLDVPLNAN